MPEERNIIIEFTHSKQREEFASSQLETAAKSLDSKVVPKLDGLQWDKTFPLVELPGRIELSSPQDPHDVSVRFEVDTDPQNASYLARGIVESDADLKALEKAASASRATIQIFSDVKIAPQIICPGDGPLGNDNDVETLLKTAELHKCGLDGSGVLVAVVDTGFNMEYLLSRGKRPNFDAARSWVPNAALTPGHLPVSHGTMVAYDVCIAAPRCTLLDIALLLTQEQGETIMSGLLSDAVLAYRHLLDIMLAPQRPGECRSLVVNNSWGMFHPSWDFKVGHPGNYSDNLNHPFNRIVGALERAGADILFAAGNCGADCPDWRCQGATNMAIYGANSHPQVLSVAGNDVEKNRVGYSTIGPGRLSPLKPDISGYTHFSGSGVYAADGGTSAASPVVAGVVAALRSGIPYNVAKPESSPAAIRNMLTKTAEDRGLIGYDFEYGWGIVNGQVIAEKLCRKEPKPKKRRHCTCCHRCHCHHREETVCCEEAHDNDSYHDCHGHTKPHRHQHHCHCGHKRQDHDDAPTYDKPKKAM
jgi:subtilisin family serine protease